jgi:hypothetical protein
MEDKDVQVGHHYKDLQYGRDFVLEHEMTNTVDEQWVVITKPARQQTFTILREQFLRDFEPAPETLPELE